MMPIGRAARRHRARLFLRGLAALIAILAVVAGVPTLLIYLDAIPHSVPSAHQVWTTLTTQDDGHLIFGVLAAGVWICWALFTLATIQEFLAGIRKRHAPHLPGLRGVQLPAAALVASVLMIFATTPVAALLPRADTTSPPPPPATHGSAQSQTTAPATPDTSTPPSIAESRTHPTYVVHRHDTLWKIAQDHLGDPLRYREIRSLNPGRVGPNNEIVEHTILTMPHDAIGLTPATATPQPAHDDTVQPGDTLSAIAQRELGSAADYPELYDANAGRTEPNGTHLTDPDLIEPGWTITIPATGTTSPTPPSSQPHSTTANHHTHRQPSHRPETPPAPPSRTAPQRDETPAQPAPPPSTAPADSGHDHAPAAAPGQAAHAPAARSSTALYELLGAGGGLLAAGALAALIVHRRRAFRHRRPGRAVAAVPEDLVPLERALLTVGDATLERVTFLDQALRTLLLRGGPDQPLPGVLAACLNDTELVLVLTDDAPEAPEPWTIAGPGRWVLAHDAQLPLDELAAAGTMAPYPCLVSVGHTAEGQEWLLDLEQVAVLSLTGDRERCLDLARYMAAELCHNRWSDHLIVTLCGVGADLVQANPTRLAYTDDLTAAATQLSRQVADQPADVDVLAGRQGVAVGDGSMPHILLATQDRADDPAVTRLLDLLAERPGGAATALVLADTAAPRTGWELRIDADGTATIPALDLQFVAHRLPEWLANDLGRAIALERDLDTDIPVHIADPVDPWEEYADATGNLRPEHTLDRQQQHTGPVAVGGTGEQTVVNESILPLPDETYTSTGAATTDDLASLAPAVSAGVANGVRDADPDLDADLAAWHDPAARRPKLALLGPVQLTAHGRPPVKQLDLATEVIAYIAMHRGGVTLEEIATDLWPDKGYTTRAGYPKTQISTARHWLGIDHRTGNLYLPEAGRAGNEPYRIRGLLIDADLFRRLRTRAMTRGDDGITDLLSALQLVRGTPFDRRRAGRWSWLTPDVEALHTAMIIDVAHLVATHALAINNTEQVRQVCEIALSTGASDDIALLDLIAVNYAEGHDSQAEAIVQRILVNNDAEIEEDLPPRTFDVLHKLRRQWAEAS